MRQAIVGGSAAAALVVTSYAIWSFTRPGPIVPMHTQLRHDDFLFSVNGVRSATAAHDIKRMTVDILVVNQAKRVGYNWRDTIAFVEDESGRRYAPVSKNAFTLSPGESRIASVEFQLPKAIAKPVVRFWDGIYMGDAFDAAKYARTRVSIAR